MSGICICGFCAYSKEESFNECYSVPSDPRFDWFSTVRSTPSRPHQTIQALQLATIGERGPSIPLILWFFNVLDMSYYCLCLIRQPLWGRKRIILPWGVYLHSRSISKTFTCTLNFRCVLWLGHELQKWPRKPQLKQMSGSRSYLKVTQWIVPSIRLLWKPVMKAFSNEMRAQIHRLWGVPVERVEGS